MITRHRNLVGIRSPFGNAILDRPAATNLGALASFGLAALSPHLGLGRLLNPRHRGRGRRNPRGSDTQSLLLTVVGVGAGLWLLDSGAGISGIPGIGGISGPVLAIGAVAFAVRPELSTVIAVGVGYYLYSTGALTGLFQSLMPTLMANPLLIGLGAYVLRPELSTLLAVGALYVLYQGGGLTRFLPPPPPPPPPTCPP